MTRQDLLLTPGYSLKVEECSQAMLLKVRPILEEVLINQVLLSKTIVEARADKGSKHSRDRDTD